jgi:hypothetical protein
MLHEVLGSPYTLLERAPGERAWVYSARWSVLTLCGRVYARFSSTVE